MKQTFVPDDHDDTAYLEHALGDTSLFTSTSFNPQIGTPTHQQSELEPLLLLNQPPTPLPAPYPPLPELPDNEAFSIFETTPERYDIGPPIFNEPQQDGDEKEEEEDDDDDDDDDDQGAVNLTSSGRRSRSNIWPRVSGPPPTIARPLVFQNRTIGHAGQESGRNLTAVFRRSDDIPRTRYNLQILRGRPRNYLPDLNHYPASNTMIPGGLTLAQICERYPRHVWGTCLRMYIAEGWTGEQIYKALPEDFRDSKAAQRPWNYVQQGFTREVKRMNEEDGLLTQAMPKKRSAGETDLDDGHDDRRPPPPQPKSEPLSVSPLTTDRPSQPDVPATMTDPMPVSAVPDYGYPDLIWSQPASYHLGGDIGSDPGPGLFFIDPMAFARQAEIEAQDQLLLRILNLRSGYRVEPLAVRLARVNIARARILSKFGIVLEYATLNQLERLTRWLEGELQTARQQIGV